MRYGNAYIKKIANENQMNQILSWFSKQDLTRENLLLLTACYPFALLSVVLFL